MARSYVYLMTRLFRQLCRCVINIYFLASRHSGALLLQTEYKSHIVINLSVSAFTSQRTEANSFTMQEGISLHLQFIYHGTSLLITDESIRVIIC
jgi:hypothetical protein